jgi:hypothetical protein
VWAACGIGIGLLPVTDEQLTLPKFSRVRGEAVLDYIWD